MNNSSSNYARHGGGNQGYQNRGGYNNGRGGYNNHNTNRYQNNRNNNYGNNSNNNSHGSNNQNYGNQNNYQGNHGGNNNQNNNYHNNNNQGGYNNYNTQGQNSQNGQNQENRGSSYASNSNSSNMTASGIPLSNTVNAQGKISYLPGTASLVEEIDKKQLVMLRDGRILIGTLRSVDQFANLVLQDTVERITVDNEFCDLPRGIYLIRGENVALMGDVDQEMEGVINNQECRYLTKMPEKYMQQKSLDKDQQNTEEQDKKLKMLRERGMTMFREMPGDQYV